MNIKYIVFIKKYMILILRIKLFCFHIVRFFYMILLYLLSQVYIYLLTKINHILRVAVLMADIALHMKAALKLAVQAILSYCQNILSYPQNILSYLVLFFHHFRSYHLLIMSKIHVVLFQTAPALFLRALMLISTLMATYPPFRILVYFSLHRLLFIFNQSRDKDKRGVVKP